jgi:dTDP-4-amino-4,6-dideoxygalactose transaminase
MTALLLGIQPGDEGDCPVTEEMSDRLLRLPFYNALTKADQALVVVVIGESWVVWMMLGGLHLG